MLRTKHRTSHSVLVSRLTLSSAPPKHFVSLLEISSYNDSTYLLPHLGTSEEAPCPTLPTFCRKETPRWQHPGKIIPSTLGTVRGETVEIRVWWRWCCWGLADQCGYSPRTWFHPDLTFSWASWWLCLVFHFLILIVRIIKMPTSEGSREAEMKWRIWEWQGSPWSQTVSHFLPPPHRRAALSTQPVVQVGTQTLSRALWGARSGALSLPL